MDGQPEPRRVLPTGLGLWIEPMIFTHRIVVGSIGSSFVDDAWCYHTREAAEQAADAWDPAKEPEPSGWHRHPMSGRRRYKRRPGETECPVCGNSYTDRKGMDCPEIHNDEEMK